MKYREVGFSLLDKLDELHDQRLIIIDYGQLFALREFDCMNMIRLGYGAYNIRETEKENKKVPMFKDGLMETNVEPIQINKTDIFVLDRLGDLFFFPLSRLDDEKYAFIFNEPDVVDIRETKEEK